MSDAPAPVQETRQSTPVRIVARVGLVARAVFYLLLAYLAGAIAAGWDKDGRQVNANGALATVADTGIGLAALWVAAIGFAMFGVIRIAGAIGDRDVGRLRRLGTAGQGVFYLFLAFATVMFLLGRRETGSEQQHESTTARLLNEPAGRWLVGAVGAVVVAVCLYQLWVAVSRRFTDSLRTEEMSPVTRRLTRVVGIAGIVARAAIVAPVGVFLVLAAVTAEPGEARGLDAYLAELSTTAGGRVLVWTVAAGFVVFAVYTLFEVRYRNVGAGE
ncbi:MAG: DUF1206 domain-containing protein [Jiangellaceae bacterium]|nr:DUF1206 domain-containing protein [Jiangellaceae bacterium]